MAVDLDDIVITNVDVDVRRDAPGCRSHGATRGAERHREYQAAARDAGVLQEFAAAEFPQAVHDSPPAARRMALRIRV